jgi:hypothetical protein
MGNSYTRQSAASIITGAIVQAAPLNDEFNALQSAFDGSTGHSHDGTTGEGQKISLTSSITGVLPVANGGYAGIHKVDATVAPTVSNDSTQGYSVGSSWLDVTNKNFYKLLDATPGAAVWKRYQTYSSGITSIAGLTTAADQMLYTTAPNVYATTALTSLSRTVLATSTTGAHLTAIGVSAFAQTMLDDADAVTVRSTLGLGSMATQSSGSVSVSGGTLTGVTVATPTITNPTITGGSFTGMTDIAIADGGTGASTASSARANLGLQDMSTQAPGAVAITGGSITGITDLAIADGGTGASTDSGARTNLGLGNVDNTSDLNKPVSNATTTQLNLKLNLAGGTMTGALTLAADPASALQASTKQYTDLRDSQIESVSASVAANALTVQWTPTGASVFRNSTLATGGVVSTTVASVQSLVVPSGATLGTISGVQAQLVLLLMYNAGTPALGIINISGGVNLDETTLISSTAISAGSSSASVVYSTSAITNSPFKIVGYINVTEATAGAWVTAPSLIQGAGGNSASSFQSIGFGQTWQSVTRNSGTTYYNTTNKPILVKRNLNTTSSVTCTVSVNGTNIGTILGIYNGSGTQETSGCFIVPPGQSYVMTDGGTGFTLIGTWELR